MEILPGIHVITMPTPFAVGDVHAYLLKGEPLTLVDAGLYWPPARRALEAGLAEAGVVPADLEQIILTHSHLDHIGQARWLQESSGADVLAHPAACGKIRDLAGFVQSALAWSDSLLDEAGLPPEHHSWAHVFYGIIPQMAQNVTPNRCLDQGDILEAGGQRWRTFFHPGHAGDLITFWQEETGILLGNDHLLAHISSNALLEPPRFGEEERRRPLIEYWASLEHLDALPVRRVLPGHGSVIDDHHALLAERRLKRDRRLERIASFLGGGPQTAWQIAMVLFPDLGPADFFLGISEVIGHLDILIDQGRVARVSGSWPLLYGPAA